MNCGRNWRDMGSARQPLKMVLQAYDITSGRELAHRLGVSPTAGNRKFKDTRLLTVADLEKLNLTGLPIDAIRGAIGGRT